MDEWDEYVVLDGGEPRPLSADCAGACAPGAPAWCDMSWCRCMCHERSGDDVADAVGVGDQPTSPGLPGDDRDRRAAGGGVDGDGDVDVSRAADLDDRPDETLRSLARDLAAERFQGAVRYRYDGAALLTERFGPREQLLAERHRRAA